MLHSPLRDTYVLKPLQKYQAWGINTPPLDSPDIQGPLFDNLQPGNATPNIQIVVIKKLRGLHKFWSIVLRRWANSSWPAATSPPATILLKRCVLNGKLCRSSACQAWYIAKLQYGDNILNTTHTTYCNLSLSAFLVVSLLKKKVSLQLKVWVTHTGPVQKQRNKHCR